LEKDILGVFRGYGPAPTKIRHPFQLCSDFQPAGDQPQAIESLCQGIYDNKKDQVLLGVTGSGKTFTMAHVIQKMQKTTLVLAPNKILAAQLYAEMKGFFPHNAVEYFVSYYDYYQPEAYVPRTDTFIEKESAINEKIERMRHSATRALLEREDVIVVASVSCIYGLGAIESYQGMSFSLKVGDQFSFTQLQRDLVALQYQRNDIDFQRGCFRVRGDRLDVFPAHYENRAWRLSFFGNDLEEIFEIDSLTGEKITALSSITLYPNSHYVAPGPTVQQAIHGIRTELEQRVKEFEAEEKWIEAQRIRSRVGYDLENLSASGFCPGIENYSRYLTGRGAGQPPPTLFEYLPRNSLFIVDESHVSVPQLRAMYAGDRARKSTLSDYGFRLPSCKDNRPLTFDEWEVMRPLTVFVSATPGPFELEKTKGIVVEQLIRPTGLLDPECFVHPTENQIDHLLDALNKTISEKGRALVTTLTKKMAEDLAEYISQAGIKVRYLHSDIDTLERIHILQDLRKGVFDVLVGINLLREGLDIPECQMVAILDADKEGYLRSKTSLIQTIGRAARHPKGHVMLYADKMTNSLAAALDETQRRREKQTIFNKEHGITPSYVGSMRSELLMPDEIPINPLFSSDSTSPPSDSKKQKGKVSLKKMRAEMQEAALRLEFEKAALLRDQIALLEKKVK
jgi:excinuclease ABC subunit B